ncbi:MAG: AzlD domain-containing protein [Candidatus Puniceispirillaceae bacterium]
MNEGWLAILVAVIATAIWRVLGVLIYEKITSDSLWMRLINMLAYSLLGAVMVLLMINPTGVLATSDLNHRIIGVMVGVALLYFVRKLPIAIMGAIASFATLTLLIG